MDMNELKKMSPEQQNKILEDVRREANTQTVLSLVSAFSEKCTQRCITSPGLSLSGSEKQCLQRCVDRWMDSFNIVASTFAVKAQREMSGLGFGSMNEGPSFS
uniref:Mitochondrial import inner membrane translocase subunit n=1 Tax=Globodera rostochiensis TaxID=31243 RepID=A0A914I4X7_GLORO